MLGSIFLLSDIYQPYNQNQIKKLGTQNLTLTDIESSLIKVKLKFLSNFVDHCAHNLF